SSQLQGRSQEILFIQQSRFITLCIRNASLPERKTQTEQSAFPLHKLACANTVLVTLFRLKSAS
ncbi:hypothetical protein, partial [Klebsiella pneumoniae]